MTQHNQTADSCLIILAVRERQFIDVEGEKDNDGVSWRLFRLEENCMILDRLRHNSPVQVGYSNTLACEVTFQYDTDVNNE